MAMIKCPECGEMVSDKAPACIHCGFPLEEYVAELNDGSPRYDLYVMNTDNTTDEDKEIEGRLLTDLLGMSTSDVYHVKNEFLQKVAQNLTVDQVSRVVGPFVANGLWTRISIFDHDGEKKCHIYPNIDGYSPEYEAKQDHYEQVIDEAQKVEVRPTRETHPSSSARSTSTGIKCLNCGSTKVQRITIPGRAVSTAVWGIASKKMAKTYKCNSCGHTW